MPSGTHDSQQQFNFFYVIIISCSIAVLWLIPLFMMMIRRVGSGTGVWGIFSIAALLVTTIAPVAYGWYKRDEIGAMLIGSAPFLLTMCILRIISGNIPSGNDSLMYSALYILSLSLVGGVEGFFAAKKNLKSLLIAIFFAILWIVIFLSGIH